MMAFFFSGTRGRVGTKMAAGKKDVGQWLAGCNYAKASTGHWLAWHVSDPACVAILLPDHLDGEACQWIASRFKDASIENAVKYIESGEFKLNRESFGYSRCENGYLISEFQRRPHAYIWLRELAWDRLEITSKLRRTWESLFGEKGDSGHYSRHQWLGDGHEGIFWNSPFDGIIDSLPCTIHLQLITTKEWFAREVFIRANAITSERYPKANAHYFADGLRVGERVIEFVSEENDLARMLMWRAFSEVIEKEKITVQESITVEPCSLWGYPLKLAAQKRYGAEDAPQHRLVTVVLDLKKIEESDWEKIRDYLIAGMLPTLDAKPIAYSFDEIADGFVELSSSELVALNWDDARRPLSKVDQALISATRNLNLVLMKELLKNGGNINLIEPDGNTLVTTAMWGWFDSQSTQQSDQDKNGCIAHDEKMGQQALLEVISFLLESGAHPDLHGPNEQTALSLAAINCQASIIDLLLKHGANAAAGEYSDSSWGGWPPAWESLDFDVYFEGNAGARECYDLLLLNRPSPCYSKSSEDEEISTAKSNVQRWLDEGVYPEAERKYR
jgi:hypothetical protein